MFSTISRAFGFLRIKYPTKSLFPIVYFFPVVLSALTCVFLFLVETLTVNHIINIFTQKSFESISTFVQVLPGFYIASLAAIASYDSPSIDNRMSGEAPYLEDKTNRGIRKSHLSRRRFLTLTFGYLAAVSIILTIVLFIIRLAYDTQILSVNVYLYYGIYYFLCFTFFAVFFQMILITLHGIYYLADRMHTP